MDVSVWNKLDWLIDWLIKVKVKETMPLWGVDGVLISRSRPLSP